MEQFDSSEEASSRVLEQQQRNDEQQCPSCAAELTETSVWTTYLLCGQTEVNAGGTAKKRQNTGKIPRK